MGILLFFLSGCEKDLYENSIQNSSKNIIVKNVSLNELNPVIFSKLNSKIKQLKSFKNKNVNGKLEYNELFNFYIDTDNGKYIAKDGYNSYTFPIYRKNGDDKLENILFSLKENGDYEVLLAKYDLTNEEFEQLSFEQIESKQRDFYEINFNDGSITHRALPCVEFLIVASPRDDGDPNGPNAILLVQMVPCQGGGSTNSGSGSSSNSGNGTDSGSGTGDNSGSGSGSGSGIGGNSGAGSGFGTGGDSSSNSGSGIGFGSGTTGSVSPLITAPLGLSNQQKRRKNFDWQLSQSIQAPCANNLISDHSNIDEEINNFLEHSISDDVSETVYPASAITQVMNALQSACSDSTPGGPTSIIPYLIEEQIDDSDLDPCTKGVLDSLKVLQQNDIATIFKKLNNPYMVVKPFYSTSIVIENPLNSPDALAQTNWVTVPNNQGPQPGEASQSPFNYIIRVRPAYLDGTMLSNTNPPKKPTKLSIARTLLHELIHAYFDSLYDDCSHNNCVGIKQFPELWSDYEHQQTGTLNPITDADHLTIANNFVKILACALQEFQTGNAVTDPEQIYKDLAWAGLTGIPAFNTAYPNGSDDLLRFIRVNNAEDSQTITPSTGNLPQISPISISTMGRSSKTNWGLTCTIMEREITTLRLEDS